MKTYLSPFVLALLTLISLGAHADGHKYNGGHHDLSGEKCIPPLERQQHPAAHHRVGLIQVKAQQPGDSRRRLEAGLGQEPQQLPGLPQRCRPGRL